MAIWLAKPTPSSSNEAAAVLTMREIYHAQKQYYQEWECYTSVDKLPDKYFYNPQLVKRITDNELVEGYFYEFMFEAESWWIVNWPDINSRTTAGRSFYIDQTGALRSIQYVKKGDSRANASSPIRHVYD